MALESYGLNQLLFFDFWFQLYLDKGLQVWPQYHMYWKYFDIIFCFFSFFFFKFRQRISLGSALVDVET